MTLPGEALAASIKAQWNVGTGGTEPDPIVYLVSVSDRDPNPTDVDAIYVYLPLGGTKRKFNNSLRNAWYFPRVVCHTITSAARQEEMMNEVDRIVSSGTVITGATRQQVLEINDISDRAHGGFAKYITELQVEIFTQMEASATSYGTATTATLETDELTVNDFITGLGVTVTDFLDEDDMASDSAVALATQQSIKAYIDQVNMIGDANKEYVNCVYEIEINNLGRAVGSGSRIKNVDGNNMSFQMRLPLPAKKGNLKLYVDAIKTGIFDADGAAYVTKTFVYGQTFDSITTINEDPTNGSSQQELIDTFTAHDCSGYDTVVAAIDCVNNVAGELDIVYVSLRCYYDTV